MNVIWILLKKDFHVSLSRIRKDFFLSVAFFILLYFAFYRCYLEYDESSALVTVPGIQNVMMYYTIRNFPLFVTMALFLCYLIGENASKDLHTLDEQYLLRCSKKWYWFCSKLLYACIITTVYYGVFLSVNFVLHALFFGVQCALDETLALYFNYVEIANYSDLSVFFHIWVFPYFLEIFISILYVTLEIYFSPVLSMFCIVAYCCIAMYLPVSPFLFIIQLSWSGYPVLLVCILFGLHIGICLFSGFFRLNRYDYLQ